MSFLCKDCWVAHEPATLLARCKVCEANSRRSRLDPLPSRAANAGPELAERASFVCRLHPSEPLDLFCKRCERQLSPRAVLDDRSIIAVIGDTASGKTSLLWMLSERLRSAPDLPVKIRQPLGDTDQQLATAVQEMLDHGRMRVTPETDAVVRNYAWELVTTNEWPARSTIVAFHDAPGEVWRTLETRSRDDYQRLYEYLDLVGSVIFIVDGERLAEQLRAAESTAVRTRARAAEANEIAIIDAIGPRLMARGGRIPAAIAVSKADTLWDLDPAYAVFQEDSGATPDAIDDAVRKLLAACGRRAFASALDEVFAPVQYYAFSALGRTVPPGMPVDIDSIRPSRVHEPLLALIGVEVRPANE
ncbi:MAG TPA: hypothetical protein VNI54_02945 [Thermoanaerobaculia bacterium]|nr:hypothetical protein [Thermoanaerobaculia bacterium]